MARYIVIARNHGEEYETLEAFDSLNDAVYYAGEASFEFDIAKAKDTLTGQSF